MKEKMKERSVEMSAGLKEKSLKMSEIVKEKSELMSVVVKEKASKAKEKSQEMMKDGVAKIKKRTGMDIFLDIYILFFSFETIVYYDVNDLVIFLRILMTITFNF